MKKQNSSRMKGVIPYLLGSASISISYIVVSSINYALTDSFGISAMITGMILLTSRIFDGFTDIITGFIIDRTNTRWGKARPYDLAAIPLWISLILLYSVPQFGLTGKVIWVFIMYNISQSVFYTLANSALMVRIKRSFRSDVRAKVISVSTILSGIIVIGTSVIMPILIGAFEHRPHGWTIISSIVAVPCMIFSLIMFVFLKEYEEDDELEQVTAPEKVGFIDSVKILVKNKYVFLIGIAMLMVSIINSSNGTAGNYFFTYIMHDIKLASIPSLFSTLGIASIAFMPMLNKKAGNKGCMLAGFTAMTAGHLLKYLIPSNMIWITLCTTIAFTGLMFAQSVRNLALIDCMVYGEQISGKKLEGIYTSVIGLADKLGLGLGSFLAGAIMQLGHYDGSLSAQGASAIHAIKFLYMGMPAVCGIIAIIALMFYDLDKKVPSASSAS